MALLVEARTNRAALGDIAGRIKASQSDEIDFMQGWLRDRDEMPGLVTVQAMTMATNQSIQARTWVGILSLMGRWQVWRPQSKWRSWRPLTPQLSTGSLQLMIAHHEGAVTW